MKTYAYFGEQLPQLVIALNATSFIQPDVVVSCCHSFFLSPCTRSKLEFETSARNPCQSGSGQTSKLRALNPSAEFHPRSHLVACSLDNGQACCSFRFQQLIAKSYSSSSQVPSLITIRAPSSEAITSCLILFRSFLHIFYFTCSIFSTHKPLPRQQLMHRSFIFWRASSSFRVVGAVAPGLSATP